MKRLSAPTPHAAPSGPEPTLDASVPPASLPILSATADAAPTESAPHEGPDARAFAEPLLGTDRLDTGESTLAHADALAAILRQLGGSSSMQAAAFLTYTCEHLSRPQETIAKAFGENLAALAVQTHKLLQLQRQARHQTAQMHAQKTHDQPGTHETLGAPHKTAGASELAASQTESVRKMLLAFSRDLRVVMLRLASRLQTLRYFAASRQNPGPVMASESLHVFAPLANRLGIGQIKWEMEDLAFRFLEPATYKEIARLIDEKRAEREAHVEHVRQRLEHDLRDMGIEASVQGRPKHIYSIVKKMRGKSLDFAQIFDIRALRVVVPQVQDCYAVLALVHTQFTPEAKEFDDYIAKPKPNGYQSLHTVVRDAQGRAFEIQIRSQTMHTHAEHGVAAHWAYKEAGTKGYAGVSASSAYDAKIAVLRQLLAWERDLCSSAQGLFDDRIYVLTPQAAVVELPQKATAVDFAYTLHTNLGHRCRGARVDGALVTLNTPLQNGQTVQIMAAKDGGPSRDWLNADLGYLVSHRARAKVRAWFNAQAMEQTAARGREAVEKLLQREGKTALKLDDLAASLGMKSAEHLFERVGKDELSVHTIEAHLRPAPALPTEQESPLWLKKSRKTTSPTTGNGVLVVGIGALMTQLAKCCKPAPPDAIGGFVTRGKGVSVHRTDCTDFLHLCQKNAERVVSVQWTSAQATQASLAFYPVDVVVQASDRPSLLRDISEALAREKINVVGMQTQSLKGMAWMTLTLQVSDTRQMRRVITAVGEVAGVHAVKRK